MISAGKATPPQAKLDEARDRTHDKGLTKQELDDLEKSLKEKAPERVRQLMKNEEQTPDNARRDEPQPATFKPAGKLDMPVI